MTPNTPTSLTSPVANAPATFQDFLPSGLPEVNTMAVFGLLLAVGVLGGLVAARARWLPSITGFMAVGLLVGPSGFGLLSGDALAGSRVLVDIALGLILFKLGATLHPVKFVRDRRLLVTALVEGMLTFGAILALMLFFRAPPVVAVLAAAIAVSSSPAVLIHVAEELHAKGPVLESTKSLVAANNVLSFVLFSLTLPLALRGEQFDMMTAMSVPLYQMLGASVVAVVVAAVVTGIARMTRHDEEHFRFALVVGAVMLSLGLSQALKVSGLFSGLALGIACRWLQGRTRLTRVDFGGGGDVFFVILFVFAGANLHLNEILEYAPMALAFVAARTVAKLLSVWGCGRAFGQNTRQALSSGMLLVPMAGLAIGLVQTTTQLMPDLGARVAAIVLAAVAVFETVGPPLAAFAMRFAGEAGKAMGGQESPSMRQAVVDVDADPTAVATASAAATHAAAVDAAARKASAAVHEAVQATKGSPT